MPAYGQAVAGAPARMKSLRDLDRLLDAMSVAVQGIALRRDLGDTWSGDAAPAGTICFVTIVSGSALVTVNDRAASLCAAGSTMLIPPHMRVSIAPTHGSAPFIVMGIAAATLTESFGLLDRAKVPVVESIAGSPLAIAARDSLIAQAERSRVRLGGQALANSLMKALILSVLERFFERPGIDQKVISALADPALAGPVAMILDNVAGPHCLASLAARAGLSASTFVRQFQVALGMPPMEFVSRARLNRAAELLRSGVMPVKAIAGCVGFASRSHFSKAFRDLYGRDPSRYREEEGPVEERAQRSVYREAAHSGVL